MDNKEEATFQFYSSQNLIFLTGRKAKNLEELLSGIKEVEEMSIYYHSHHYLDQREFLSPEPPNDFFYWITHDLQNKVLGEVVASIDLRQMHSLKEIQSRIVEVIERSLMQNVEASLTNVSPGEEFLFMSVRTFVYPTKYTAASLSEFRYCLRSVPINSIYFHIFGTRFNKSLSSMSEWLSTSLNEVELAQKIEKIDPYTITLENLRDALIRIVEKRLMEKNNA
ncbi:MAG: hypothetical protein A3J84_09855 [Ignavibacteria bacterium RIFOXYA2_FULL_37_17]|nr:MAG: hypothetical protein A3J84_09855 [Ignavibacteria bacterium RIFOXYA2_FULL_37_17]